MNEVRKALNEICQENRIEILKLLEQRSHSLPEIKRYLKSLGSSKPHTTVARYLDRLIALNIIRSEGERFAITARGCLLLEHCEETEKSLNALKAVEKYPNMENLTLLPKEFLKDIWLLREAEVVEDVYTGYARAMKTAREAREKILMIVLVANKEATQINLSKALGGAKMKGIVESSTIPLRQEIRKELEVPLRLNAPEVREKLTENFLIRKYSNLPLQIGTMDSSIAGIQFMNPQKRELSPYFISENKEFIDWVERIFNYYWERSEPVVIY